MKYNINIGDKVVCITSTYNRIKKFGVYTVLSYLDNDVRVLYHNYILLDNKLNDGTYDYHYYDPEDFVNLKEHRKNKINNLYS